jgi:hypothetical protein
MFFEYNVTYPPLIFPEEEQVDVLRLTRGIVKRVEVVFPRGCAGLVGVRIFRGPIQIIPLNAPAWLDTDGETIGINTEIDLSVNPYEVEIRGYNLDDTYSHTIRFRFELELIRAEIIITNPAEESESLKERLGL